MKLMRQRRFIWLFWLFLFLYAVKPSVVFLTNVISACFIDYNVCSVSLYRLFCSSTVCIVCTIICALLTAFVIGSILIAKRKLWRIVGVFLMICLLPFLFSEISFPANLCFGGGYTVSICKGEVAGLKVPFMANSWLMAVKLKDVGYPPYAIFNGLDIGGTSRNQVGDEYIVKVWLNDDARARLSRILERYETIGYLVVGGGEMRYVDVADGGLQKNGMYYVGYCGKSEESASDAMFMVDLAPMPSQKGVMNVSADSILEDDGIVVCGERIMNLDSFIAKRRIRDCGQMSIHGKN